jgi:hypothetical protein
MASRTCRFSHWNLVGRVRLSGMKNHFMSFFLHTSNAYCFSHSFFPALVPRVGAVEETVCREVSALALEIPNLNLEAQNTLV